MVTKSQVDQLGKRLRQGSILEEDLRTLDAYRRSFASAYETVSNAIRAELDLPVTGRPAKSTSSIVDKLRRESVRLTQMQDIAGCRLVVTDVKAQDLVVDQLRNGLAVTTIVDRRLSPSHNYRAVHVIASVNEKSVEIQIRTALQHRWAELSEKLSDVIDPSLKYGGGSEDARSLLRDTSELIAEVERLELQPDETILHNFANLGRDVPSIKMRVLGMFDKAIGRLSGLGGR